MSCNYKLLLTRLVHPTAQNKYLPMKGRLETSLEGGGGGAVNVPGCSLTAAAASYVLIYKTLFFFCSC